MDLGGHIQTTARGSSARDAFSGRGGSAALMAVKLVRPLDKTHGRAPRLTRPRGCSSHQLMSPRPCPEDIFSLFPISVTFPSLSFFRVFF